jgi:hypothetical protein
MIKGDTVLTGREAAVKVLVQNRRRHIGADEHGDADGVSSDRRQGVIRAIARDIAQQQAEQLRLEEAERVVQSFQQACDEVRETVCLGDGDLERGLGFLLALDGINLSVPSDLEAVRKSLGRVVGWERPHVLLAQELSRAEGKKRSEPREGQSLEDVGGRDGALHFAIRVLARDASTAIEIFDSIQSLFLFILLECDLALAAPRRPPPDPLPSLFGRVQLEHELDHPETRAREPQRFAC